jgi:hypothetical protein
VIVGPRPAVDRDLPACAGLLLHRPLPQSSSASRRTAGAAGFFSLIQSGHFDGPGR